MRVRVWEREREKVKVITSRMKVREKEFILRIRVRVRIKSGRTCRVKSDGHDREIHKGHCGVLSAEDVLPRQKVGQGKGHRSKY